MKDTVKKVMWWIKLHHYQEIESKLESMAVKGLFLDKCGPFLWTFRRGEPKHLHYTVTYFSEGSLFNPGITDNQQTYFDYAQAAGWTFVTQYNQMQIFCSEADNPIPFETDESEKFINIKRCIKKSFLPSIIMMFLVFLMNLLFQLHLLQTRPIDVLSDATQVLSCTMIFTVVFYSAYSLLDYFIWCQRSKRSIATGGTCYTNTNTMHIIIDILFLCFTFGCLGWFLLHLALENKWFYLLLGVAQMPLLLFVFWFSIQFWRKKQASAILNRVLSITVLIIVDLAYLAFIILLISNFDISTTSGSDYRTVTWPLTATDSYAYKLYSDDIPLTCEDLYGENNYPYYSYEEEISSTIFLTKSSYRQDSLPAEDAPPRIAYEILEPQFHFVYQLAKKELLQVPDWRENLEYKPIDNKIFGTLEAYQEYYDDLPAAKYILFFNDKIIVLQMAEPASAQQISVIKDKLQIE